MLRPVEKAEKIRKDAQILYKQVTKAYKLVEEYETNGEEDASNIRNFMLQQSSQRYSGALKTGANNLQKVLQNTCLGKMPAEEALKNIQTINISVMTVEMVAAEILSGGKQSSLDEERF